MRIRPKEEVKKILIFKFVVFFFFYVILFQKNEEEKIHPNLPPIKTKKNNKLIIKIFLVYRDANGKKPGQVGFIPPCYNDY